MRALPDRLRSSLEHPARAFADHLREHAPALLWHSLHPGARQPFVEAPRPVAARRHTYRTDDGWRAPVFVVPEAPGTAGEPVVLLHTLGLGPHGFRYGRPGSSLADALSRAGFRVYLPAFRGDTEAVGAARCGAVGFDEVVVHDLPAILDLVSTLDPGAQPFLVGHGLGGQLAVAHASRCGGEGLAGVAALSAPVRFDDAEAVPSALRAVGWLPTTWRSPTRAVARLAALWTGPDPVGPRPRTSASPRDGRGPRLRGALVHATEDVPVGLLQQLGTWMRAGALCDRTGAVDYGVGLGRVTAPLWMAVAPGDSWCPPRRVRPLASLWGGRDCTVHEVDEALGHLDLLVHPEAHEAVFAPLVGWMVARRHRARAWSRAAHAVECLPRGRPASTG